MAKKNILGRLKKDLGRSPKKTAILAIGTCVALYFWAPLLLGWLPKGEDKQPLEETTTSAVPADVAIIPVEPTGPPTIPWNDLVRWMREDPRMKTAMIDDVTNPFPEEEPIEAFDESEGEAIPAPRGRVARLTPDQFGLTLGSVIIGPSLRTAQISGKTYHENDVIDTAALGAGGQNDNEEVSGNYSGIVRFTLTEIGPVHVVLTRNGEDFALPLRQSDTSQGSMTIVF